MPLNFYEVESIARICHETNKAYCDSIGDTSQKHWNEAEQWQRQSAIRGVQYAEGHMDAPASAQHDSWAADKLRDGWKFGEVKDADKKEHPCLVPYAKLPIEQRTKDHLFKAVVRAFLDSNAEGEAHAQG